MAKKLVRGSRINQGPGGAARRNSFKALDQIVLHQTMALFSMTQKVLAAVLNRKLHGLFKANTPRRRKLARQRFGLLGQVNRGRRLQMRSDH